jgi:hypothetical protein
MRVPVRGYARHRGQIAQLVEQRTENPRVVGSIPTLATISFRLPSTYLAKDG